MAQKRMGLPSRMAHCDVYQRLGRGPPGVLVEVRCGMVREKGIVLAYIWRTKQASMNWCRSLKVWARSQRGEMASRNRFVTRQDHWDLMLSLTGTRTRGTYVP